MFYKKFIRLSYKSFDLKTSLFLSFFLFTLFYFFNFDKFNSLFATDFIKWYKPNGLIIFDQITNLKFNRDEYISFSFFYLIPKLLNGILLNITYDEISFSIFSNFFNIIILFLSFYFFLKNIEVNLERNVIFFFLIFFFIYIGNWEWCFWKLADVYFLFIFSVVFYYLHKGIEKNNLKYLLVAFSFSIISVFTKPQGVIVLITFASSIFLLKYYNKNFFKILLFLFLFYFLFTPLLFFLIKSEKILFISEINFLNQIFVSVFNGNINFTTTYKYEVFLSDFSLSENNFTEILYFYFLTIKKILYQITFIRETYSFKHNVFLIFYVLSIYFFLILNYKYLIKNFNLFLKLIVITNFFALLFYGIVPTAQEPNRYQLFHLTPLYILVAISINRFLQIFKLNTQ
jgi:hypothetical protein